MVRAYDNTRRAQLAAESTERIVDVTESLLREGPLASITLQAIAERAGVTVQTVLRKMGSRDGCVRAAATRIGARIAEQRGQAEPGDVEAAIDGLLLHYETDGRLVLNLLAQERTDAFAEAAVRQGRAEHRAWAARCFGPCRTGGLDGPTLDALVTVTDLYVWKLLRLDLGRSQRATRAIVLRLVRQTLEQP